MREGNIVLGAKGRVAQKWDQDWKLTDARHMSQHCFRGLRRNEAKQRKETRLLELQLELARTKYEKDVIGYELAEWWAWWANQLQEPVMNADVF